MIKIMGYASLFGIKDLAGDIVEKGAFLQSLKNIPVPSVRMLYQHDAAKPIGEWTNIIEDEIGLWVEGQILLGNNDANLAATLIKSRHLDGLSIGFRTLEFTPNNGGRILKTIDLREISLVAFPMLPRARLKAIVDTYQAVA